MYPVREAGGTRGVKRYMKSVNSRVFRVAITYIVLAVLWVLVTDYFLQSSVTDVRALTWFQNYKGVAFVLFSGGLVYLLLSREVNQRERKWKEYLRDREQLLREVQRNHDELERAYEETIEGWARAMEMRNREVKDHSLRVTELVLRLGQAMGLDEETLSHMRRGSLLHDIGKMNVPDAILMKEGPLSPSERELIEKHPDWAYEMLAPVTYLQEALEDSALSPRALERYRVPQPVEGGGNPAAGAHFLSGGRVGRADLGPLVPGRHGPAGSDGLHPLAGGDRL